MLLLQQGANVNAMDMHNRMALVHTVVSMKDDFAEFLLNQGTDLNINFQSTYNGDPAMMTALVEAIQGELSLVQALGRNGACVEDVDR